MITKKQAIELFGTGAALARAVGIARQNVYKWPDALTRTLEDRVIAAAVRHGKPLDGLISTRQARNQP